MFKCRNKLTRCFIGCCRSQRISSIFVTLTNTGKMKKLHLCLLFSLAVFAASSQKVYFVYIQTESEQPFFVKMNDKIHSSTGSGYIILSKLIDSNYNFSIGFPQSKWQDQNFNVVVNKKDHGFLLKSFGDKGWGLFDLQTLGIQMAISGKASVEEKSKTEIKEVSAFTEILSKAADDPSLKEKIVQPKTEEKKTEAAEVDTIKKVEQKIDPKEQVVVKKEEPKSEVKEIVTTRPVEIIEQPVAKKVEEKDTALTKPVEIVEQPLEKKVESKIEFKGPPVVHTEDAKTPIPESYKVSLVKKWSESSTTEGFGLVYIDDYSNGLIDTIRLLIPNPKPIINVEKEEPKGKKKFLEITTEIPKKEEEKMVEIKPAVAETPVEKPVLKNKCIESASETDFFQLRKKMAAEEGDDNMISEAKKYFRLKCFTTGQLKNISTLFLTDEGKYNFFDAAYKYVSDPETFNSLQAELKDEYYISRFKAMLRN